MKKARVSLVKAGNRRENVFQALQLVRENVAERIKEEVVLKPNLFDGRNKLAVTHVDAVRGALDFLSTLPDRPKRVVIAESPDGEEFEEILERFGYAELPDEYEMPIQFFNLNLERNWVKARVIMADGRFEEIRISRLIADSDCILSVAVAKTHDVCFATLGYKNVAVGSVYKLDQVKMHGYRSHSERRIPEEAVLLNINLIRIAHYLKPHVAVIDGTVGLQGNGPGGSDTVDFGIAAASTDVFAADAVVAKAMGFEPMEMGYLYYANSLGLGIADLERIDVLGRPIEEVALRFKPHERYKLQFQWRTDKAEELLPK
jgi:uncharacterized protein (DUF362 family)